jgi:transposase
MTEKKDPKKEVNKSEEIRKIANAMKAKGEKPRPVVIIATLKKQGIEVSSPQVSMVLKKMGFRPRKRGSSKAAADKPASKPSRNGAVTVDDVLAAKKMAAQFGSVEKAIKSLQALQRLS